MGEDADFEDAGIQGESVNSQALGAGQVGDINDFRSILSGGQDLNDALLTPFLEAQGLRAVTSPFDSEGASSRIAELNDLIGNDRAALAQMQSNLGGLSAGQQPSAQFLANRGKQQTDLAGREKELGELERQLKLGRGRITGFERIADDELGEFDAKERDITRGFFDQSLANQRGETPDSLRAVQDLEQEELELDEQLRRQGLQPGDSPYDRALRDFNDRKEARLQELRRTERGDLFSLLQGSLTNEGNRTSQTLAQTGAFPSQNLNSLAQLVGLAQLPIGNDFNQQQFTQGANAQNVGIQNEEQAQNASLSNQRLGAFIDLGGQLGGSFLSNPALGDLLKPRSGSAVTPNPFDNPFARAQRGADTGLDLRFLG